jgi:hypothetical protein
LLANIAIILENTTCRRFPIAKLVYKSATFLQIKQKSRLIRDSIATYIEVVDEQYLNLTGAVLIDSVIQGVALATIFAWLIGG